MKTLIIILAVIALSACKSTQKCDAYAKENNYSGVIHSK